jgi:hypothetical protein
MDPLWTVNTETSTANMKIDVGRKETGDEDGNIRGDTDVK